MARPVSHAAHIISIMNDQSETPSSAPEHPIRRLDTPEAREYAEWCLLVLDLEREGARNLVGN